MDFDKVKNHFQKTLIKDEKTNHRLEKIFSNRMSDKRTVSREEKELLKQKSSLKRWTNSGTDIHQWKYTNGKKST